jgi:hypothetical protein
MAIERMWVGSAVAKKKATPPVVPEAIAAPDLLKEEPITFGVDLTTQQLVDSIVKPEPPAPPPVLEAVEPDPSDILKLMLAELRGDFMPVLAKIDICEALIKRYRSPNTTHEAAAVLGAINYLWRVADRQLPDAVNVESKRDRTRAMAVLLNLE